MNTNVITVSGNLVYDPDAPEKEGRPVKFKMAVNGYKDKTNFFRVAVFGDQGQNVLEYVKKGRFVVVTGEMNLNETDMDGTRTYFPEIVARSVEFGPERNGNGGGGGSSCPIP